MPWVSQFPPTPRTPPLPTHQSRDLDDVTLHLILQDLQGLG
jgi:hypothetical protein